MVSLDDTYDELSTFFKIFTLPPSIFYSFCIYYRIKKAVSKVCPSEYTRLHGLVINIDY